MVYAFNVGINKAAWKLRGKVPIKSHNVIYKMFDDIIEELSSRLPPLQIEEIEGMVVILKCQSRLQQTANLLTSFPIFAGRRFS